MWRIIGGLVKLVVSVILLLLFGYFELQMTSGFIVSILVGLYLYLKGSRYAPWVVIVELVTRLYEVKTASLFCFILLDILFFIHSDDSTSDTKVIMRPYEKEIREYLFKIDPSVLHKVDGWLDKFKAREKELFSKLAEKYENQDSESDSEHENEDNSPFSPQLKQSEHQQNYNEQNYHEQSYYNNQQQNNNFNYSQQNNQQSFLRQRQQALYASYTPIQREIVSIVQEYDPALIGSVGRILSDYKGREEELLQQLKLDYNLSEENNTDVAYYGYSASVNSATLRSRSSNSSSNSPVPLITASQQPTAVATGVRGMSLGGGGGNKPFRPSMGGSRNSFGGNLSGGSNNNGIYANYPSSSSAEKIKPANLGKVVHSPPPTEYKFGQTSSLGNNIIVNSSSGGATSLLYQAKQEAKRDLQARMNKY